MFWDFSKLRVIFAGKAVAHAIAHAIITIQLKFLQKTSLFQANI